MRGFQDAEPSARDAPGIGRRPGNFPAELTAFIGRRAETTALKQEVARSRLVTVTGAGGVGKSRTALHAARQSQERFCDGVWLVELAAVRDPDLLAHAVVEALGVIDHSRRPPLTVLTDHLADRRLLLVLDCVEHLVEPCADLVHELLRRAPRLRVLVTGRRPLGVAGEVLFPLGPLTAPAPGPTPAATAVSEPDGGRPLEEAAELFAARASAVVPGFSVTDDNRRLVEEICHRLDGIPLALELAAGRLRTLSLEQTLARLDDRFRLLVGGARGAPAHHQTLRTAVGWSHELCTPQERLLWARLSVFAGDFDLDAVEYVCGGPELTADEALDVLSELVAQSIVSKEETRAGVRYRMLDTLRAYGADWLEATGDAARMRRRHRDWCTGLVTYCELEWFSARQAEVAARLDVEMPNLRAALEYALEDEEDGRYALHLAATLWFCWVGCGRIAEGRHWLDRVLELETDHEDARLDALWVYGYVAVLQGDTVGALSVLQECGEGAERTGNQLAAAYAVHLTGCLALINDEMPRAELLLSEALRRYEEMGTLNSNVLVGRSEYAMAIAFQGDLDRAVELCEEVRQACEDSGEQWASVYALYVLSFAAWQRKETAAARELMEHSLRVSHTFRDLVGTVQSVEMMALITATEGDAAEAAVLQGAAGRLWRSVGMPLFGSDYFNYPHKECERMVREQIGTARQRELQREGERLDMDEAVARALYRRSAAGQTRSAVAGSSVRPSQLGGNRLPAPAASRADDGEAAGGAAQRA
ncbi:ATP-binding protein [Streptomyces avicenniae]|uniref:ATP-binding protein n=1 Tax=Streptomyces avicenniae TaxID=500153 RepID=UPI00069B2107|nr:AAA family ATPase [Streptomyces avicenniae]